LAKRQASSLPTHQWPAQRVGLFDCNDFSKWRWNGRWLSHPFQSFHSILCSVSAVKREDASIHDGPNRRAGPHGPGRFGMDTLRIAQRAVVGISAIKAVEAVDGPAIISEGGIAQTLEHRARARATTLDAIRKAFADAGVTFLPDDGKSGPGIRFKPKSNIGNPQRNSFPTRPKSGRITWRWPLYVAAAKAVRASPQFLRWNT
jgi:hypothetical protein